MTTVVTVPRENPNDDEVLVAEWILGEGSPVRSGERICVVETTKSTIDVEAPADGFVRHLADTGATLHVGDALAAITTTSDEPLPDLTTVSDVPTQSSDATLTKKAEIVAKRLGVNVDALRAWKGSGVISEADIATFSSVVTASAAVPKIALTAQETGVNVVTYSIKKDSDAKRLLVIGGGNACVQILDVVSRLQSIVPIGVVDDTPEKQGSDVLGVPILGPVAEIERLWNDGQFDGVCISISNIPFRSATFERLSNAGVPFLNVIDPDAHVSSGVKLGQGNFLSAHARLGPLAQIGDNNFLSSNVSLDHHNRLGSHCTFGPGVMASGTVTIGDRVLFGTGIFIEPGLSIGDASIIASGAIIRSNVVAQSVVKVKQGEIVRS